MFCSWRAKATSVRFAALSISSIEIRITRGLRRTSTPMAPSPKRTALRSRNHEASSCEPPMLRLLIYPPSQVGDALAAEGDRPDGGAEQENRGQLDAAGEGNE